MKYNRLKKKAINYPIRLIFSIISILVLLAAVIIIFYFEVDFGNVNSVETINSTVKNIFR